MTALTDEQARFFLEANYAVVGTVNADGSPQLSTVWVDYDGECVLVNTAAGRAKPRNVERGSQVSVLVFDGQDFNRWISVVGPAEIVEEGARDHADKLAQQYAGRDRFGGTDTRLILRIRPERIVEYGLEPS